MDLDEFQKEADRIKAEQYFAEKTAQPAVVSIEQLVQAILEPADLELFKLATLYCPEDPERFYVESLNGEFKTVG